MSRGLWGEFDEPERPVEPEHTTPIASKRAKFEEMSLMAPVAADKVISVKVNNPIVTQTIEVMKQTEMLQALIDTYSNKSDFTNYLVNPGELIPDVDFPPENSADLFSGDKFTKPIWFLPPISTPFVRGAPKHYAEINADVCRAALRKAVCGQLRVAGFTDTVESALVLFTDAVQEFLQCFMREIRQLQSMNEKKDTQRALDIPTLEKAYFGMTNMSLMQVHNYYKHHLLARNRSEVAEFKEVLHEYDKLMQQSLNIQKQEYKTDELTENNHEYVAEIAPTAHMTMQPTENVYYEVDSDKHLLANTANNDGMLINNVQYAFATNVQQQNTNI